MTDIILKPKADLQTYKYLELPNKMRCLLINDPEADKSAAAIDVRVGCSLDPKPLYGTAHFLEHMLFQGTEKYPSENEYSAFMKNNGGMNNAFTSLTNTNYHFDCSNNAFEEGLDRLSQFFICPTFSKAAAEREVNAVNSEFNQSLQSDGWHYFNLC
jgi:insulysin